MTRPARRTSPPNRNQAPRCPHGRATAAALLAVCAALAVAAPRAEASSTWLTASESTSSTGDYALTWLAVPIRYDQFTLYECEGASSACASISRFSNIARTRLRTYEVHAKPEGTYTYRLKACYESGTQPRSTTCDWSSNATVAVSYLAGTEAETATAAGGMPYATGVTKGGDAYVNIPVAVVPGVNGLQPALSIDYSDGRERQRADEEAPGDILGYGWRVGGLSAIRRCVRNTADADGIGLDGADGLCIDGEPLVRTSGTHLQPGAKYRTLRESHARITIEGTAASPWFEVELPDGRVREYGRTADSELRFAVVSVGRVTYTLPLLWSINKETDAFGNEMRYEYKEVESLGARHPKRIVYGDDADAEVVFEYTGRGDVDTMTVGGRTQRQWLRLHRLAVRLDGRDVREYRLESERTTEGWLRLRKVQLCGWRDAGAGTKECLKPLSVTWEKPASAVPHMKTCVASVDDPLGRRTSFARGVLKSSGTHGFLFTTTEQGLFGAGTAPANAAALAANGSGNIKPVVTTVSRDNGIGGTHETTYAYQGRGWQSTRNWGFLGFYATRETDGASGVSTYTQYRLDFPHFGSPAAVVVSKGTHGSSGAEVLSKRYFAYAKQTVTHGSGADAATTGLPYAASETAVVYEGGTKLGAVQTQTAEPTVSGTAVSGTVRTTTAGHTVDSGTPGTVWGDAGTHTVGGVQRKTKTTTAYNNVDTATAWLAGFPSSVTAEHFEGTSRSAMRTQKLTRTRATTSAGAQTNAVGVETAFPDNAGLKLQTTYAHDADGNVTSATTVGGTTGHVASRTTRWQDFADARYAGTVRNALDHRETLEWDAALGLPTRVADANGRILNLDYDAFGREISRERTWDGVTETTTYAACGSSCATVSATASSCGVSADVAMKATTTSPDAPDTVRYYDELGRTVRTATQSFGSATTYRTADVLHNARGLVACASAPYHTGGTKRYAKYGYDARGRVTSLTRPDGGSVAVKYTADSGNSRVKATVRETVLDAGRSALSGTRNTVFEYNVLGELVETTAGAQGPSAKRSETRYAYDGGGLLKTVTVENGTADYATTFGYDDAGNRTRVANPNFAATSFVYTALGQLRTRTDGRGTTTWTYDELGRIKSRTDPGGGAAAWEWDPTGALGVAKKRTYNDSTSTAVEFEETYRYDADERPETTTTTLRKSASASDALTVTRTHTYDSRGRPSTTTTGPSALAVGYEYNARGYLSKFKKGSAALVTVTATDAWGNATGESYGNGVSTTRTFDELGRTTGIGTAKGTTKLQNETYGWRSDGLLESRAVGSGATADTEVFGYDHLGRLDSAKTYVDETTVRASSTLDRSLSYGYDRLGNLTSKPGASLRYQGTGNAGPNAATSANVGVATTISYDTSGHVIRYDAATGDDTFVEWDGRGRVSRITVGTSRTTTTPTARDEFRYGPDGERYYRRTTWTETVTGDGGTDTTRTRWAETYRVGGYEKVVGDGLGGYAWVDKTRAGAAQLVRTAATATATPTSALEYLHGDHLGSLVAATDSTGASLQSLAYEPYGTRRKADWTAGLPPGDVAALAAAQDAGRARTGFTGHEPLDRTGFVHMGGRVYDPRLGRFLSPDQVVSEAWSGQGWNLYSYVGNSPLSRTDPTGYCYAAGPLCQVAGGGGFTNVTQALTSWNMSWRIPIFATVTWGRVSFGVGGSLWTGEGGGFFGRGGFFWPRVTFWIGAPYPVFHGIGRIVSLGQETSPADERMDKPVLLRGLRRGDLTPEQEAAVAEMRRTGEILPEEYWNAIDPPLDSTWDAIILDPANLIPAKMAGAAVIKTVKGAATDVHLTGQLHHPISTPIHRALEKHPILRGKYKARDGRFVTRASSPSAHSGWQTWHRQLDKEVADWLTDPANANVTQEGFETFLRARYARPDLRAKFPAGF